MEINDINIEQIEDIFHSLLIEKEEEENIIQEKLVSYLVNTTKLLSTLNNNPLMKDIIKNTSDNIELANGLFETYEKGITIENFKKTYKNFDFDKHIKNTFLNLNEAGKIKYFFEVSHYMFRAIWEYCENYFGKDNMKSFNMAKEGGIFVYLRVVEKFNNKKSYESLINQNNLIRMEDVYDKLKIEILKEIRENNGLRG